MSGESDLRTLLRTMSATLDTGLYVFVTMPEGMALDGLRPRMMFRETEGLTCILPREEAEARGLAHEFPCRMITLKVHSALDAVGFLARITTALAAHDMGVNPVSGFFHDHLFVPDGKEDLALEVLRALARDAA